MHASQGILSVILIFVAPYDFYNERHEPVIVFISPAMKEALF